MLWGEERIPFPFSSLLSQCEKSPLKGVRTHLCFGNKLGLCFSLLDDDDDDDEDHLTHFIAISFFIV